MFFFYQRGGKESAWEMGLATERDKVLTQVRPAFTTVLDLSSVPDDRDWSKVRYRGPFYVDFDAEGELELVCNQFRSFLGKLDAEMSFDVTQARLYLSGSKGFHIEIPEECFIPKVTQQGTAWLPYIYREMAQSLMVDTLDLNVFTGKRGRMWRTPNVKRENGCYKVPITVDEALSIDPDLYLELIQEPRGGIDPTPPSSNAQMVMLFQRCKDKVSNHMRGKRKRGEQANALLDPWRKARRTPPTIEGLMSGELVADGAGFQALAMQIAIYASSVSMPLAEMLDRCRGLIENHVSDSNRYRTPDRRREELARMWEYMGENDLYDFDPGPILRLVKPDHVARDFGAIARDDNKPAPKPAATEAADTDVGDTVDEDLVPEIDPHGNLRRGVFSSLDGFFVKRGEVTESLTRASFRNVRAFYDAESRLFKGYELDVYVGGKLVKKSDTVSAEVFLASTNLKKYLAHYQAPFMGGDTEAMAISDIVRHKAEGSGMTYTYPREGFMFLNHPDKPERLVPLYLTQSTFVSSIPEDDPEYFRLQYRPSQVMSSYRIDIDQAPVLGPEHAKALVDLFGFNKPEVVASTVGWFVACYFRSLYLATMQQFPLLHVYGEAGSGKSQTVLALAHLHWYDPTRISMKSAMASTSFAFDAHAGSSTSAPFILDEWKPRELRRAPGGKYEKAKDGMKMSYIGGDIGERGTINKGAENGLSLVRNKASAPIVFMAEGMEAETAIMERSVLVAVTQAAQTTQRTEAFERLKSNHAAISALGRALMLSGFGLEPGSFRQEVLSLRDKVRARMALKEGADTHLPERPIYNQAVVAHGLTMLRRVLNGVFETTFDEAVDELISLVVEGGPKDAPDLNAGRRPVSEITKVINRIAVLSRSTDKPYSLFLNKDYVVDGDFVDLRIDRAYDQYRVYCATVRETPLFDTEEAFLSALMIYTPCVEKNYTSSSIYDAGTGERVVRFDMKALREVGGSIFRS